MASLFLVVIMANTLTMGKLFFSKSQTKKCSSGKRKATITVGIISGIYCVCNIGFIVIAGIPLFSKSIYRSIPIQVIDALIYILLPLNSACNPLVYMFRRADMIPYFKALWKKLIRFCLCKEKKTTYVKSERVVTTRTELSTEQ